MEAKKKSRRATRAQFTKVANSLKLDDAPTHEGEAKYKFLKEIAAKLDGLDKEIENLMENGAEADIEDELDEVSAYKLRWLTIQTKHDSYASETISEKCISKDINYERNYKLPRLESVKFDGNIRNWMPFWGQFEKIDSDEKINDGDKLLYLKQSMTPGTEVGASSRAIQPQVKVTDIKDKAFKLLCPHMGYR